MVSGIRDAGMHPLFRISSVVFGGVRHRQRARALFGLIVSHIARAGVPYDGNRPQGRNRPKVKEFLTAIKNKSTFAIANYIFFDFLACYLCPQKQQNNNTHKLLNYGYQIHSAETFTNIQFRPWLCHGLRGTLPLFVFGYMPFQP